MLQKTPFWRSNKGEMAELFRFLETCLEQIVKDNELGALQQALRQTALCCVV